VLLASTATGSAFFPVERLSFVDLRETGHNDAVTSADSDERPIARVYGTVLDCTDVDALAGFWQRLLGYQVAHREDDWVSLVDPSDPTRRLSVQQVDDHRVPTWPTGDTPQQLHLDLVVDDLQVADPRAQELGAVPIADVETDEFETFRVYRDPAGHPFCLIQQLSRD
jgi:catechol 2,3-dioxygenase-like lactoylglutathione lyase family enzyme